MNVNVSDGVLCCRADREGLRAVLQLLYELGRDANYMKEFLRVYSKHVGHLVNVETARLLDL